MSTNECEIIAGMRPVWALTLELTIRANPDLKSGICPKHSGECGWATIKARRFVESLYVGHGDLARSVKCHSKWPVRIAADMGHEQSWRSPPQSVR